MLKRPLRLMRMGGGSTGVASWADKARRCLRPPWRTQLDRIELGIVGLQHDVGLLHDQVVILAAAVEALASPADQQKLQAVFAMVTQIRQRVESQRASIEAALKSNQPN